MLAQRERVLFVREAVGGIEEYPVELQRRHRVERPLELRDHLGRQEAEREEVPPPVEIGPVADRELRKFRSFGVAEEIPQRLHSVEEADGASRGDLDAAAVDGEPVPLIVPGDVRFGDDETAERRLTNRRIRHLDGRKAFQRVGELFADQLFVLGDFHREFFRERGLFPRAFYFLHRGDEHRAPVELEVGDRLYRRRTEHRAKRANRRHRKAPNGAMMNDER